MFLNPHKPIATCVSETCDDCPANTAIHCHFELKDLIHFLLISLPSFLLGGAGIYNVSGWLLIPWLLVAVAFFGLIEIRVMCSHCPHYAEPASSLKCWANYGSPKLWKYRPGPMTVVEKIVFFSGLTAIWGYPLLFLISGYQWFLMTVYAISTSGFFQTLKTFLCSQCMNFACPLNAVDAETRRKFLAQNPTVANAWHQDKESRG